MIDSILLTLLVLTALTLWVPTVGASLHRLGDRNKKWLRQAGFPPREAWPIYVGLKVVLLIVPLLSWGVLTEGPLWPMVLALVGFCLPDAVVLGRRRARQRRIRASLSFFLDLLVALISSGLTLTEAFRRAGESLRQGRSDPLADEVDLVVRELDLGKSQERAFFWLAERTGVDELARVASALRLGLRLGSSLESTLDTLADQLRSKRREEAMATIQRASAQALFPIFLCAFPTFSVLVFYPAAIELRQALEALREFVGP